MHADTYIPIYVCNMCIYVPTYIYHSYNNIVSAE